MTERCEKCTELKGRIHNLMDILKKYETPTETNLDLLLEKAQRAVGEIHGEGYGLGNIVVKFHPYERHWVVDAVFSDCSYIRVCNNSADLAIRVLIDMLSRPMRDVDNLREKPNSTVIR